MRVCLVGTGVKPIPPTGYGGVERTISEYASALRLAGHEPVIVNEVRSGRPSDEYRFAVRLLSRLRDQEYDVLHASTPVVANRLAWAREPYVYTTHSRHWFELHGVTQRWGFWLERRAVQHAAATVALTGRLASQIRSKLGRKVPARMEVIPIGVDLDLFRPEWEARNGHRALGVGVVLPFKRWELAARALRNSGLSLTIVGPTPDPAYADRVRSAGDQVELAGELSDSRLARLYAQSDLLVHPSRVELLAGVVLQALAAGLPVLGAEPVRELVEEGRTGFCAGEGATDAEVEAALQRGARMLVRDPERLHEMGEAARGVAAARFAWPAVVERHVAVYGELQRKGLLTRRRSPST